jgi:hypothetical protein
MLTRTAIRGDGTLTIFYVQVFFPETVGCNYTPRRTHAVPTRMPVDLFVYVVSSALTLEPRY